MDEHKVVLHGQPGCGPCEAVKASLERAGIAYIYVDVTTSPDAGAPEGPRVSAHAGDRDGGRPLGGLPYGQGRRAGCGSGIVSAALKALLVLEPLRRRPAFASLLTPEQTAMTLGVTVDELDVMRAEGRGPNA